MDLKKVVGIAGGVLLVGSIAAIVKNRQIKDQQHKKKTNSANISKKSNEIVEEPRLESPVNKHIESPEVDDQDQFVDDYNDYEENFDGYADRSPNDQRSDVMNPNNPDYQNDLDNRANQMNPNNSEYNSSRGQSKR